MSAILTVTFVGVGLILVWSAAYSISAFLVFMALGTEHVGNWLISMAILALIFSVGFGIFAGMFLG